MAIEKHNYQNLQASKRIRSSSICCKLTFNTNVFRKKMM
ncbi:uncharacterized protein G2W53_027211 [Senna tora]|uniref:Uncharacterized protein n=1 Tax=Senna tora TaxID=362788 RepID=A0A834TIX2_9FABA|nr:uncharacterized protein G2W53_027211 [Senna tora]